MPYNNVPSTQQPCFHASDRPLGGRAQEKGGNPHEAVRGPPPSGGIAALIVFQSCGTCAPRRAVLLVTNGGNDAPRSIGRGSPHRVPGRRTRRQTCRTMVSPSRGHEGVSYLRSSCGGTVQQAIVLMGHIIHLRVEAASVPAARALAIEVLEMVHTSMVEIDPISTTVSEEGCQNHRYWVLCGARVKNSDRCVRLYGHPGVHDPRWPD
jgi:hypothetical protein